MTANISKLSPAAAQLLISLQKAPKEGVVTTAADGTVWDSVYLDNVSTIYKGKELSGLYSALTKAGFYKPVDQYFGDVLRIVGA